MLSVLFIIYLVLLGIEEHKKKSTNRNRQEPEEEKPPSPTHLRRSGRRGLSKLIQLDDEDNDDFAF